MSIKFYNLDGVKPTVEQYLTISHDGKITLKEDMSRDEYDFVLRKLAEAYFEKVIAPMKRIHEAQDLLARRNSGAGSARWVVPGGRQTVDREYVGIDYLSVLRYDEASQDYSQAIQEMFSPNNTNDTMPNYSFYQDVAYEVYMRGGDPCQVDLLRVSRYNMSVEEAAIIEVKRQRCEM